MIKFRIAKFEDLPAVVSLLAEMDDEAPMPLIRAERIFREMMRYPDYRCYLAFDGDTGKASAAI
jgi:hypothetical protein